MQKNKTLLAVPILAAMFSFLFYKQALGVNLLIFEAITIAFLLLVKKDKIKSLTSWTVLSGTMLSATMAMINYSTISIVVNIISFFILVGVLIYPETKSMLTSIGLTSYTIIHSFDNLGDTIKDTKINPLAVRKLWRAIKIIIIPVLIILLFILLYKFANPIFEEYLKRTTDFLNNHLFKFFHTINFGLVFHYLSGLAIYAIILFHVQNKYLIKTDQLSSDFIKRRRKNNGPFAHKPIALKNELKAGIFLLAALNLLILTVNSIDIYWVWFNFEWDNNYLKQFVHEGTYLLIVAVLISMAICLYFFRGNLNFYAKNRNLKLLGYIWLVQNAIMVISVALRNLRYIEYYALAYKRIGVIFFLIATLYGIYTVIFKIRNQNSTFFLFRRNTLAIYILFIVMTFFNWDTLIARYNFKHYEKSYVHLSYLSGLSDRALPYLDQSLKNLETINQKQQELFSFIPREMFYTAYFDVIAERKLKFKNKWENKTWKSWNLAEQRAYNQMKE